MVERKPIFESEPLLLHNFASIDNFSEVIRHKFALLFLSPLFKGSACLEEGHTLERATLLNEMLFIN